MLDNALFIALTPLLPFAGFLIAGLLGHRLPRGFNSIFTTILVGVSALFSWIVAFQYLFVRGKTDGAYEAIIPFKFTWLKVTEGINVDIGAIIDPASVVLMVVVTTVAFLVFIYSIGYMKHEGGYHRYFAFLSLFTFSMLALVMSVNLVQLYIFWELVGLSSFLLIGFYYQKHSAVAAAKKAFIVTRFADVFFLIGILVLAFYTGTLDIPQMTAKLSADTAALQSMASASFLGLSAVTWALVLVFMGGAGKSAMFPLHIWLPDAMEGPTPVSALIHAATMVVAGVYLIARMFPAYAFAAQGVLELIAFVGAITALFAAIIACTQFDIKRILAYSTISQIGFMLFALGVARLGHELGYMAGMFHLFTHAFFKALLFLGAGTIIHYIHSNDIREMGGLRKAMPLTHATFLIACLAIAGVPPLAGFFSKEYILTAAFEHNTIIYVIGLVTAGLTAFYMFRLYFTVFHGTEQKTAKSGHESPAVMLVPLVILAVGSVAAGFVPFYNWVTPTGEPISPDFYWIKAIVAVAVALTGILLAMSFYRKPSALPDKVIGSIRGLYNLAYKKFYIDEIYLFVTKNILFAYISRPFACFDRHGIDGAVNKVSDETQNTAHKIRGMQSGDIQHYLAYFMAGVIGLILVFVYVGN